jgi:hypothetical protein
LILDAGGWTFEAHRWSGHQHQRVHVAEDFRFRWSLGAAAERDAIAVTRLLDLGIGLYGRLTFLSVFCPGCSSGTGIHKATYRSTSDDGYPSTLRVQLQHQPWVRSQCNGEVVAAPQEPGQVWWSAKVPTGAGLHQSPLRYLPLCDPAAVLSEKLRRVAGVLEIETADLEALRKLLHSLRNDFENRRLPVQPADSSSARQAFVGLHRLAYERLADLFETEGRDKIVALLDGVQVLCDIGESIAYRPRRDARHDDGRYAGYRRYFSGSVPFAVLPREKKSVADRLGLAPFSVTLTRRNSGDDGRDVTEELNDVLADRIPELLAIVVHHSLGTQTLEPTSQAFEERARRLHSLRVRQVDNLIVDAQVEGTGLIATMGEGLDQDIFLEGPTSAAPVLFHDFAGGDGRTG